MKISMVRWAPCSFRAVIRERVWTRIRHKCSIACGQYLRLPSILHRFQTRICISPLHKTEVLENRWSHSEGIEIERFVRPLHSRTFWHICWSSVGETGCGCSKPSSDKGEYSRTCKLPWDASTKATIPLIVIGVVVPVICNSRRLLAVRARATRSSSERAIKLEFPKISNRSSLLKSTSILCKAFLSIWFAVFSICVSLRLTASNSKDERYFPSALGLRSRDQSSAEPYRKAVHGRVK